MGWRAHRYQIFYKLSRIILWYSDFIFYVATTKNNKIDFGPYIELIHYIAIQLSESLKLLRTIFIIVKQNFLDLWNFPKHLVSENRRGYLIF